MTPAEGSLRSVPRVRRIRGSRRAASCRWWLVGTFAVHMVLVTSCAGLREAERVDALHVSHLTHMGDAQRRASLRLVVVGLEADASGQSERALATYERAIQVDATNPYAYLALARHWIEAGDPARGVVFVDQAEVLLEASGESTLGAQVHLDGLRGRAAAIGDGSDAGVVLLQRAAERTPEIWGDGILSADELR